MTKLIDRGFIGLIVGLALFVVIVVGVAYHSYKQDWSLQGAVQFVKETSQDTATTAGVRTALSLSKRLSAFDIKVESRQGEVTLTGKVPSKQIKEAAGAMAQDILGVRQVHNQLTVNSSAGQKVAVQPK